MVNTSEHSPAQARPLVLPFVNTSFAKDLYLLLAFWPLWWLAGVDQLIVPAFAFWEFARLLAQSRGRLAYNAVIVWTTALAIWWIVPIWWADRSELDIFIRGIATIWSQVILLVLFYNAVRSDHEQKLVRKGLILFAVWQTLTSLIFILGIWRKPIVSLLGAILPQALVSSSEFLKSISYRSFGVFTTDMLLLPIRPSGLSLQENGVGITGLLLIPFIYWYARKNPRKPLWLLLLFGFLTAFIFVQSRLAYVGFAAGVMLFVALFYFRLHEGGRKFIFWGLLFLGAVLLVLGIYVYLNDRNIAIIDLFTQYRVSSLNTRLIIYRETIRMLGEHPLAGWGYAKQIEGMSKVFSAGSHSSYLGMLFQHGIVGLIFYLGLWFSIWKIVFHQLKIAISRDERLFWSLVVCGFLAINIREAGENWWWDQSITIVLWGFWGLVITAHRFWGKSDVENSV